MNVLVTAAGRRTSLVKAFVQATHARGGQVVAGDVDPLAPALEFADAGVRLTPVDHPDYVDDLLATVDRHAVKLLLPTIDPDLPVLAAHQERFAARGCRIALSSEPFVAVTSDKYLTHIAFREAGVSVARTWLTPIDDLRQLPERVVMKPRQGSASQGVHVIRREELDAVVRLVRDPVVQEVLEGPEITIDALLDFAGRPIHFVPRRRIKTLAGESLQGVTLEHDAAFAGWLADVLAVCGSMGAAGPLTLQAFLTARGPVLSEINARVGGGLPLALAAGADYPTWLLDLVEGRPVPPRLGQYESGLYMTRYYDEQFTRQLRW